MTKYFSKRFAALLVFIMLPVFTACGGPETSGLEYKETHIHIGHEEIMNGYPQSIIDPLWWAVSIYDGEKKYNEDLGRFTLPQRYVFAIQWYAAEVNNGGHAQFYYNSTGIVYPDALRGFQEIGHQRAYDILNETIALAGGKIPLDRSRREKLFDRLSDSKH
ncbi:MAG: DMP19 family protein, partial [Oscillospiraceae bacterium]|nr:DMP19 family protein [Oscillospiraceae bacterium]